jgi:Ni/Co efflux regulator RcnB
LQNQKEEFGMKKKLVSLLVAMLFTAGTIALPISASAQGTSGQTAEEGQAKKSTAKKSKKKSTAKKPSTSQKKKTTSKKTQDQT